jgi:hypothetical protein
MVPYRKGHKVLVCSQRLLAQIGQSVHQNLTHKGQWCLGVVSIDKMRREGKVGKRKYVGPMMAY